MTRIGSTLAALASVTLLASGCEGTMSGSHVDSIRGQLGDKTFAGTPEIRDVRLNTLQLAFDMRLTDPEHHAAIMVGLNIPRRSDDIAGTQVSTSLGLYTVGASAIGCSGERDGDWDFDCPAGDVQVFALDSGLIVFHATFDSETCDLIPEDEPSQTVEGTVDPGVLDL